MNKSTCSVSTEQGSGDVWIYPRNALLIVIVAFIDDPYYCGMRARIPNFAKKVDNNNHAMKKSHSANYLARNNNTRKVSYPDSGLGIYFTFFFKFQYSIVFIEFRQAMNTSKILMMIA